MNFKKARKKTQRIRKERTLLFIYAVAVTAALIISINNNNKVEAAANNVKISEIVPEETNFEEELLAEDLKVSTDDEEQEDINKILYPNQQSTEIIEEQIAEQNSVLPPEVSIPAGTHINHEIITVAKGDSFIGILKNLGLDYTKATELYKVYKKVFDARNIKIGQDIDITTTVDDKYNELVSVDKIIIEPISGTRYVLEKTDTDTYESKVEQDNLKEKIKTVKGIIKGNVSTAMKDAGVAHNIVGNFINIFSFSVDFRRDVKAGDEFEVRYTQNVAPNGNIVKNGDIIYASLKLGKDKIELYRFEDSKGNVDYYDEKGLALKKTLDKKPLAFKNARISSRFGRRLHPIFKDYRNHHGIDYAAPSGTKVFASGDGTVTQAKWVGGYGYFVKIRHNSEYTTGYAHLKSFAKGIRPGVRVKQGQVIAYVGNTGRSTGPHLHFEVVKNGKKVDPFKIKAATGENLKSTEMAKFKKVVAEIKAASTEEKEIADNDPIGDVIEKL